MSPWNVRCQLSSYTSQPYSIGIASPCRRDRRVLHGGTGRTGTIKLVFMSQDGLSDSGRMIVDYLIVG